MNLDSKNLIRWGIPGWMLLAILLSYFTISDYEAVKTFIFSKDVSIIVSSITLFIGTGIIIGNLIHHISLSFGFIIWINKNKYFKNEYEMDLKIIKNQFGKEIQRIYSYRLGNVHALRVLSTSLFLSLLILVILSLTITFSIKIGILLLIVLGLNCIVFYNWVYFQNNFNYFIKKIKSDFEL
ncbi:hypothetical protein J7E63_11355 [Bacillus sp. ISL-75]|uniref:hypothetical protein n=1 Tax=Bacillus sp. ISL-75 TaxID=2819137 RepID=UPI001BEBEAE5|nr:hypothetical protein [Bacillus sp. ISL-75]MBT2727530.1 hypothetical protein [Bacillus sp. ISL-75]